MAVSEASVMMDVGVPNFGCTSSMALASASLIAVKADIASGVNEN